MGHHHLTDREQLLLAIPFFFIAVAVLVARTLPLPTLGGIRLSMAWLMDDFRIVIYCPTALLIHGGNPYDRQQFLAFCPVDQGMPMYLPSAFYLHALFGLLPMQASAITYMVLTILLTLVLAAASDRISDLPIRPARVLVIAALLLLSRPGQWNALLGQPTLELVLGAYVGLRFARRRPWLSGLGLAVAMYKPTFGIPLMFLMLARGDRRAVATGIAVTAALNLPLIAILASRAGGLQPFLDGFLAGQREWEAKVDPAHSGVTLELAALVGRLIGHRLSTGGWVLVTLVVLGVTAGILRRIGPPTDAARERLSNSLICIATLLAVHHHAYDLLLLTAPVVALTSHGLPPGFLSRRWEVVLYVLYGVLAANYLGSLSVLSQLEAHPLVWMMLASVNGAALFAIFLIYAGRTVRIREDRPSAARWPSGREPLLS
jgi:Glycosyltransferase family 87